jgi:hypothetical protein
MSGAPQRHEMVRKGIDPSGAEEWLCQQCGRHFIVRWPPRFERVVLHPGDESATHFGGKGDVVLSDLHLSPAVTEGSDALDDDAWRRWLRQNGIDWDE